MKYRIHIDDWEVISLARNDEVINRSIEIEIPFDLVKRYKKARKLFVKVQQELHNILGDDARDSLCR
jgi:hypothetical protein